MAYSEIIIIVIFISIAQCLPVDIYNNKNVNLPVVSDENHIEGRVDTEEVVNRVSGSNRQKWRRAVLEADNGALEEGQESLEGSESIFRYQPSIPSTFKWSQTPYIPNFVPLKSPTQNYAYRRTPIYSNRLVPSGRSWYGVHYLPPVHTTYIHGLMPRQSMAPQYDIDVISNAENTLLLPTHIRPARRLSNSDEELMTQLNHDMIVNNILPTMPVPFFAGRSAPVLYGNGPKGYSESASTVFPYKHSGCAQPLLFTCRPQITYGVLGPNGSIIPKGPAISAPNTHVEYREEDEHHVEKPEMDSAKHSDSSSNNIEKPVIDSEPHSESSNKNEKVSKE